MKLNRSHTLIIGVVIGLFMAAALLNVELPDNITTPPVPQDTAELWRIVDSIRVQTLWDRLKWEQRVLRKAREGK